MTRPAAWRSRGPARLVSLAVFAGSVALAYAVFILALGRLPDREKRDAVVAVVAASAVAALVHGPAQARAARSWRPVHGAPEEVVRSFNERTSRGQSYDELLANLAGSLRRTLRLRGAEVWTAAGEHLERVASSPDIAHGRVRLGEKELSVLARTSVVGEAWLELWAPALLSGRPVGIRLRVAPAVHSGSLLGLIVAERGDADDPFHEDDDLALAELGRRLGVVLHNRVLDSALQASLDDLRRANEELRASRTRLVAAADAERRRIERDLHDGAQQHLVALAVKLRLARDVVAQDPEAAAASLDELSQELRDTIQQVRDLAHGIYPPLLADAGLAEALRAAAKRSPLPVSVDTDGVGRYGTDVESAVYFCALEALQNATKHAPDAPVRIRAWEDAGGLHLEVADDGPGFDPAVTRAGHGFVNMSDRLGAIGGTVAWASAPGEGTVVRGAVPLGSRG